MKRILLIALGGAVAGVMLTSTGCYRVPIDRQEFEGTAVSDNGEIDLQGAERLDAHIMMGVGELSMSSAESSAVVTDFEYSRESWRPRVTYDVMGDTGRLEIRQPDGDGGDLRGLFRGRGLAADTRYAWDIGLPAGIPTDLQLDFGVGEADVALGGLLLEELRVNAGIGDVTIDLSGDWTESFEADIEAGVGDLTLRVPRDVGVRVLGRHDGLGDYRADGMRTDGDAYVNDAYGTTPVTLDIELRRGVGDVEIELVD